MSASDRHEQLLAEMHQAMDEASRIVLSGGGRDEVFEAGCLVGVTVGIGLALANCIKGAGVVRCSRMGTSRAWDGIPAPPRQSPGVRGNRRRAAQVERSLSLRVRCSRARCGRP